MLSFTAIKVIGAFICAVLAHWFLNASLLSASWAAAAATAKDAKRHSPNIVIIFIDDMGYADIGPFGANAYKTPHLDSMAQEGRIFTDFHSATAVCSASRAGLMTGCYPERVSILGALRPNAKIGINDRRDDSRRTVLNAAATRQRSSASGTSAITSNSCRCSTASTNTSACRTQTTCRRCRPRWSR